MTDKELQEMRAKIAEIHETLTGHPWYCRTLGELREAMAQMSLVQQDMFIEIVRLRKER